MTDAIEFALLPIASLRPHEEVVREKVRSLAREIRAHGEFVDPIWVAREPWVILNGHHRVAALRSLGAERVPAWLVDYMSDHIRIGRWTPGPPISKAEVLRRAREGRLFPPRTTRHSFEFDLPHRPTPLAELGGALAPKPSRPHRSREGSAARSARAGSSPPG